MSITKTRGAKRKYKYEELNWTIQNKVLAKMLKISPSTICKWRKRLGKENSADHCRYVRKSWIKWDKADWSLPNNKIAKKLKCTRERVRQKRMEINNAVLS